MKLTTNEKNKLVIINEAGEENAIHVNHTSNTIEEIKEDIYKPFFVAEAITNFARIHLLTARDEQNALETISEYIQQEHPTEEDHDDEEAPMITAQQLEIF